MVGGGEGPLVDPKRRQKEADSVLHRYLHRPHKLLPNFCKSKFKIRDPKTSLKFSDFPEGPREHSKAIPVTVGHADTCMRSAPGRGDGICKGPACRCPGCAGRTAL